MPAKKFAAVMLNGTIWTEITTGQLGYDSTVTIHVVNHNNGDSKINLALTTASPITTTPIVDIFELEQLVFARNSRQFPGIVLPAGVTLAAQSDTANVSVLVYGFEEEI